MLSSLRRQRPGTASASRLPDTALLLSALPDPVIALDSGNIVRFVNPAAEQFFGASAAALSGHPLADIVSPQSPVFALVEAVRRSGGSIALYDVPLEGPRFAPRSVTIQGAPTGEGADLVVLSLHERSMADKMDRQETHRNAARSVTAMAAMLAHEVKNPLSGIRGAAQLLEQDVDEAGRELTQLICDETDRIVALVDRMEAFSEHAPITPCRRQHPRGARPGAPDRAIRLRPACPADRGVRPLAAAGAWRPRPPAPGFPQPRQKRRRGRPGIRAARSR